MAQEKLSRSKAAHEKGLVVADWTFPLRKLGDNDVEIKISHCGICHSDLHCIAGDWGAVKYPHVVGHEIVGHVTAVGPKVTKHKIGARVGVGPQQLSCQTCKYCRRGDEMYCPQGVFTYGGGSIYPDGYHSKGGYAEFHRVHEGWAIPIPDAIPSDKAAPLLCAGITVYSPLRHWNAGPGKNVAVIGIGGLGHLAIQYASKLGATVTAISSSQNKEKEAMDLGADIFLWTEDDAKFFELAKRFDIILNTGASSIDFSKYLSLLDVNGTFVNLGGGQGSVTVETFPLMFSRQSIAGSLVGSPGEIEEMLTFSAKHKIFPMIETVPFAHANEAIKKVADMKVRYRVVLDIASEYK